MNEVYMKKDGEFKPLMLAIGDGADFIVEQGTSGIWTYRKWSSGICECWGSITTGTLTMNATGSIYASEVISYDAPDFLNNIITIQYTGSNLGVLGCTYASSDFAQHTLSLRVNKTTNNTASVTIRIAIQGKWK